MIEESVLKEAIIKIIRKHILTCDIYLFGSRARKTNRSGADVDVALGALEPIHFMTIGNIKEDLEESNIPLFVDIVDLKTVSDVFLKEFKQDAILWQSYK